MSTRTIADELRRQWAERDSTGEVLLESLDEHLPPPNRPVNPNPSVARIPVVPQVEPVAHSILFPVYPLALRPVNLASYQPDGK